MAENAVQAPAIADGAEAVEEGGGADPVQLATAFGGEGDALETSAEVEGGSVSVDASAEGWDAQSVEADATPEATEASEMQSSYVPLQLLEAEKVRNSFAEGEAEALRKDLEKAHRELEEERQKHLKTLKELEAVKRSNHELREEFQHFKV